MRQISFIPMLILQCIVLLASLGCSKPSLKSIHQSDARSLSSSDPFINDQSIKQKTPSQTKDLNKTLKFFSGYSITDAISDIQGGHLNSTDLILFLMNNSNSINIGYEFCIAGGKSSYDCNRALNNVDFGFGLCMTVSKNDYYDCYEALGKTNTGFGLCMAVPGNDYYDCYDALGKDNLDYGLCMTGNGNDYYDCYDSLKGETIGFGICMTGNGNDYYDCYDALKGSNIGYGFCMTGKGKDYYDCYNALGENNTGYGLCMIPEGNDYYTCKASLGSDNSDFGMCLHSGRDFNSCSYYLEPTVSDNSDFILTLRDRRVSINKESVNSSDAIKIDLDLRVNNPKLNSLADIYVVALVISDGTQTYYHKNGSNFEVWDGRFESLKPFKTQVTLKTNNTYSIFDGNLNGIKGDIKLYYGYLYNGYGMYQLQYNKNKEISFKVQ